MKTSMHSVILFLTAIAFAICVSASSMEHLAHQADANHNASSCAACVLHHAPGSLPAPTAVVAAPPVEGSAWIAVPFKDLVVISTYACSVSARSPPLV
jgi:hypothetical protein